jgi:hypothetical protein
VLNVLLLLDVRLFEILRPCVYPPLPNFGAEILDPGVHPLPLTYV